MLQTLTRSRFRLWILAGAVVVAAAGLYWFGPWHLIIDRRVDEALPGAAATVAPDVAADEEPAPADAAPEVTTLAEGAFRSLAHTTTGTARIVELADGSRLVRFDELDTDSGPDLRVYLSAAPADGDPDALDDTFVDLGPLKGNQGNQNFAIPDLVKLEDFTSVCVWCRRFSVGFGFAPIVMGG